MPAATSGKVPEMLTGVLAPLARVTPGPVPMTVSPLSREASGERYSSQLTAWVPVPEPLFLSVKEPAGTAAPTVPVPGKLVNGMV